MKKTGANFELEPAVQRLDHQLPSHEDRGSETGQAPMSGTHSAVSSPSFQELKADRDALLQMRIDVGTAQTLENLAAYLPKIA